MSLTAVPQRLKSTRLDPFCYQGKRAIEILEHGARRQREWQHIFNLETAIHGKGAALNGSGSDALPLNVRAVLGEIAQDVRRDTQLALDLWLRSGRRYSSLRPFLPMRERSV